MSLNPQYITTADLLPYLVDKDTGAPLAGGYIQFYEDDSRTTPKAVYQLTGSPPNYTYTALPNPVQLSATGTIVDNNGNQCALYYYPYDADNNLQLYYIEVFNSLGVSQFTREAWPNVTDETNPLGEGLNTIENLLSNPQFAVASFSGTLTIPYSGTGTTTTEIAPGWDLVMVHNGAPSSSVTVTRTALSGESGYPGNPPYILTITPGASLDFIYLRQRLYHNPGLWCPLPGSDLNWVCTNVTLANQSSVTIQYVPSFPTSGGAQTLLQKNNQEGVPTEFSNCVQLTPSSNTDTADTGYVDIYVYCSTSSITPTTLTNLQVCFADTQIAVDPGLIAGPVVFQQIPVNRQIDQLFHYYNPLLQYKPINSFLIGWDFPYNPAQINGYSLGAQALGANTSYYAWDQTIVFQSVTSCVSVAQGADLSLQLTCANAGQVALIQYLDQATARDLLNGALSVYIEGRSSVALNGTVSLWYTTGASLPSLLPATYQSLVSSIDATGFPTCANGTWTQVARSNLGNATWTLGTTDTSVSLNGWLDTGTGATTATFFAIVVGTQALAAAQTVNVHAISLVPGNIATPPAPKTPTEVLKDCQRFYEKSYSLQTLPGTVTAANQICIAQNVLQYVNNAHDYVIAPTYMPFQLNYMTMKRAVPTLTFYSPTSGASGNIHYLFYQLVSAEVNADVAISLWTLLNNDVSRASYALFSATAQDSVIPPYSPSLGGKSAVGSAYMVFHYVCDARLGIV